MSTKKQNPFKSSSHHTSETDNDEAWDLPTEDSAWDISVESDQKHLGLWMVVLAWLMAILVLAFLFNSWLDKKATLSGVAQKVTVEQGITHTQIKRTGQNQYLAKGTINNHPVVFLLDTGATDVVIPVTLAKKLKLKSRGSGYAHTAGGKVKISFTRINELSIGHITIRNLQAMINPTMQDGYVLLGMSALKHVSFTQRGDTLTLHIDP